MSVSTTPPTAASVINSTEDAALSFNISFSVNLGSLMQFPSRILARMRKLDALLSPDMDGHMGAGATGSVGDSSLMRRMRPERPPPPPGLGSMPGPWAFFASGYAIALFAMALLLNRIQHIVAPSRQPLTYRLRFDGAHGYRSRLSFTRSIYAYLFPIDLSSTFARTLFRVPTLYLLSKALALWFIILLQTSGYFPSFQWDWLQSVGTWAARKEMEDVCWSTFGAVCSALCVGALTRGLEGVGGNNTSPFNLFGYAFLLHLYSSPITHSEKQEGLPSRPDMHVVLTILMPLLQLWMVHLLGAKQSWSNQRLIPTTICSALTLIHFHSVLWFSPASYPLLNYMSCIFESLLILVTLLALTLNALTQILLEGAVTRPVFGHAATLMPKWDEDFSIVLLRLGTASLEATSVAGLGNEVSPVPLADAKPTTAYGEVQMSRGGVTSVSHTTEDRGKRRRRRDGFANEIRSVKVASRYNDPWFDHAWVHELKNFGAELARFAKGCARALWRFVRGQSVYRRPGPPAEVPGASDVSPTAQEQREGSVQPEESQGVYERFLAGEAVSDDEEDFDPRAVSLPAGDVDDDDRQDSLEPDAGEGDSGDSDTAGLYADLSASARSSATAPLLLAHLTDESASPLTRRRYKRLVSGQQQDVRQESPDDWESFVGDRRTAASIQQQQHDDASAERRRNCVICTVEERQIICWPCRCLALCDDCRENLASRFAASKHTCPCCRQPVEGFSRIYIP